ncbi:hypothetical protein BP422_15195 [Brevibacillus formosus]|uniref:Uncharacterized protein n=1 Tax=Brevibacillus formosus TaxID=54913 RepID=A0A220MIA2_9BACL|nr:hypothetical protein BP422_15195 [Brevibacillus formosus]
MLTGKYLNHWHAHSSSVSFGLSSMPIKLIGCGRDNVNEGIHKNKTALILSGFLFILLGQGEAEPRFNR